MFSDSSLLSRACDSILDDDMSRAGIDTEALKLCLSSARQLKSILQHDREEKAAEFFGWLSAELGGILERATVASALDQSILWSRFHALRCGDVFYKKWEHFLLFYNITLSPIFIQVLSMRMLDIVLKESFVCNQPSPEASATATASGSASITYEERNAIRYVGGYIIRKLMKVHTKNSCISLALEDLIGDPDVQPEESEEWVGSIDRGGLTYISDAAYQVFYYIEWSLREAKLLEVDNASNFDDCHRKRMRGIAEKDSDVQFHWSMASCDMDDEVADSLLDVIIDQYVTIRAFSFASSIMELYKIETKQCTQKAKRLRHEVAQN